MHAWSECERSNANWDQSKQVWDRSKRVWTLSQSELDQSKLHPLIHVGDFLWMYSVHNEKPTDFYKKWKQVDYN